MDSDRNPTPPPIDWAEFVEEVRLRELARRFNRPSHMLQRHSATWREPYHPRVPKWLGGPWLTAEERAEGEAARTNLFMRMRNLSRKG